MPYGMQIRTVNGLENIENLRSLREVFRVLLTSPDGSVSIPNGALQSNSGVFFETNDGRDPPVFSWSNSTIFYSSQFVNNPSQNFFLIVCRFK